MANYINLINVGGVIYDIGMDSAVHLHGAAKVTEFYNLPECTTHASDTNIGDDRLWTKGLTMNGVDGTLLIDTIKLGCMILLTDGTGTLTQYEYVCTKILSEEGTATQIAEWSCLGEVEVTYGTITTSITPNTGAMVEDVSHGSVAVVTKVEGTGAASAMPSNATLATTNYTVLTDTPAVATAHKVTTVAQTVATDLESTSMAPVTNVTISNGDVGTSASSFVTSVSGGEISTTVGSFVTEAIGSVTTATGSVVTNVSGGAVTTQTGSVMTSVSPSTAYSAHVSGTVLVIDTVVTSVATSAGTVVTNLTQSELSVGKDTILTSISTSAAGKASAVTSISQSALSAPMAEAIVEVTYTPQELTLSTSASVTIVTNLKTTSVNVVSALTNVAAITSIPTASKPVVTAFSDFTAVPVISNVVTTSTDVINSISVSTKTVTTGITQNTGSVVTAGRHLS